MNLARLIEQSRDLAGGCPQVEMLDRGLARRVAHARASFPVAEQRREGAGQRGHVAPWSQQPILVVPHQLRDAGDSGAHHR